MPITMNVPRIHRETRCNNKGPNRRTRVSKKAGLGRNRFHIDAGKRGWVKHKRRVKRAAKKKA